MITDIGGESREFAIARFASCKRDVSGLRNHLQAVLGSPFFKSSHRSQQFLSYVIENAIQGRFDSLKERVIGVDLFRRSPSYDTGEDAIVRVTASDVRKRLLQYYGSHGADSEFRIELPPGSYIPEIARISSPASSPEPEQAAPKPESAPPQSAEATPVGVIAPDAVSIGPAKENAHPSRGKLIAACIVAASFVVLLLSWWALAGRHHVAGVSAATVLPWSHFIGSGHKMELVTSDPAITLIPDLTGKPVSLSDYANLKNRMLGQANTQAYRETLRGIKASASYVDTPVAVSIAQLFPPGSQQIAVRSARDLRPEDFHTDDNYVLLGSPRSNPWGTLFSDQMDLLFDFDKESQQEKIRNMRPRPGEPPIFAATARGLGTGESFALISFVRNPNESGRTLLIAGVSAEGTEAAGRFVTDLPRLSETLRKCGIEPNGPVRPFQILLRVNIMAGSPTKVSEIICHPLH